MVLDTTPFRTGERRVYEPQPHQQLSPYQYASSFHRVDGVQDCEQQNDVLQRRLNANSSPINTSLEILHQENHNPLFTDEETWAGIFNSAGFCIQDGVFFS